MLSLYCLLYRCYCNHSCTAVLLLLCWLSLSLWAIFTAPDTCCLSYVVCLWCVCSQAASVGHAGQQLVWFSNHLAGAFIYMPAALAGALLPLRLAHKQAMSIATQVAGCCLFSATLAVILTVVGAKVAYSCFSWAAAAYISLWIAPKVSTARETVHVLAETNSTCTTTSSLALWS